VVDFLKDVNKKSLYIIDLLLSPCINFLYSITIDVMANMPSYRNVENIRDKV